MGDRQGRLRNENVMDVQFESEQILMAINQIAELNHYDAGNKYVRRGASDAIIKIISR